MHEFTYYMRAVYFLFLLYVCMYVCVYVPMCVHMQMCVHVCTYVYTHLYPDAWAFSINFKSTAVSTYPMYPCKQGYIAMYHRMSPIKLLIMPPIKLIAIR